MAPRGGILLPPGGLDDAAGGPDTILRRAASERVFEAKEVVESSLRWPAGGRRVKGGLVMIRVGRPTVLFAGEGAGTGTLAGPTPRPAGAKPTPSTLRVSFSELLNAPATVLTADFNNLVPNELNPLGVGLETPGFDPVKLEVPPPVLRRDRANSNCLLMTSFFFSASWVSSSC